MHSERMSSKLTKKLFKFLKAFGQILSTKTDPKAVKAISVKSSWKQQDSTILDESSAEDLNRFSQISGKIG